MGFLFCDIFIDMGKFFITESEKKQIKEMYDLNEGHLSEDFSSSFNDLLKLLGDFFKTKDSGSSSPQKTKTTSTSSTSKKITGSEWESCKAWRSSGGLSHWGDKIEVNKGMSQFRISYEGPASGIFIAHAANGKDTIHQLFNVLICELNPYLYEQGNLKPDIENISAEGGTSGKKSTLTITVPLERSDETYQLDRRGGWGHDPGANKMKKKCDEVISSGGKCFGPVKNIVQARFGKITEYFITYTI